MGEAEARKELDEIHASLARDTGKKKVPVLELFAPAMRLVLTIGIVVAIVQQITGINSVFFYSPMIFEQSGIGTNAAFMQAVLVGLVNLVFTLVAMALIDKLGRRPLLGFGLTGIAVCMLTLAYGFGAATYTLGQDAIDNLPTEIERVQIQAVADTTYDSDIDFREAVSGAIGVDASRVWNSARWLSGR